MIAGILKSTGLYNPDEVALFERCTTIRSMSKDEIVVNRGEICRAAFFNITGAFYQFNYKDEIDLNIIDLHCDNEWFLNHSSFISQKPSDSFIKAYTDGQMLELDIESLHFLIGRSPAFLQLAKIFDQASLRIHFFDNRLTPLEKYQYILTHRQQLIQKFPLKLLASYLKISPETLSRVRESLSKRN